MRLKASAKVTLAHLISLIGFNFQALDSIPSKNYSGNLGMRRGQVAKGKTIFGSNALPWLWKVLHRPGKDEHGQITGSSFWG